MRIIEQLREGDESELRRFVDSLFNEDMSLVASVEALQKISKEVEDVPTGYAREKIYLNKILTSLWNFFGGVNYLSQENDLEGSIEAFEISANGFEEFEFDELASYTRVILEYCLGLSEIQNFDLSNGLNKLGLAKNKYNSSRVSLHYLEDLLEALEARVLIGCGVALTLQLDHENGQIAFERASRVIKAFAVKQKRKYSNKEEAMIDEFNYFMGIHFQYKALSSFFEQIRKLRLIEYDYFDYAENEALENSIKSINYLSSGIELNDEDVRKNLLTVKTINLLTRVVYGIGQNMSALLDVKKSKSTFSSVEMKKLIKSSKKSAIENEDTGYFLLRICNEIESQLKNYENWSRIGGTQREFKPREIINSQEIEVNAIAYVKKGDVGSALEYLMENSIQYDFTNDLIMLLHRHNTAKSGRIRGVISAEEFRINEAEISQAILDLVELNKVGD